MNHKKAILLTVCVAVLWSLAGLNIKMISWPPYAIAGGRSVIASILLYPLLKKGGNMKIDKYVIGGALCYASFNYCFNISTKLASSAIAIMMQYTAPIYVAILAWIFLKEKITKADIISLVVVFAGMLLFFMDGGASGSTIGKIVAVFNGITFAGNSIFLRLQKNGNPVMSVFLGNVISGVVGIPFMVSAGVPDTKSFLFLLLAGFLCGFTYAAYAKASTGLSALETVLLPILDPVLNPVWVFLFLGEVPGKMAIIGAVIVLTAVFVRSIYGIRAEDHDRTAAQIS